MAVCKRGPAEWKVSKGDVEGGASSLTGAPPGRPTTKAAPSAPALENQAKGVTVSTLASSGHGAVPSAPPSSGKGTSPALFAVGTALILLIGAGRCFGPVARATEYLDASHPPSAVAPHRVVVLGGCAGGQRQPHHEPAPARSHICGGAWVVTTSAAAVRGPFRRRARTARTLRHRHPGRGPSPLRQPGAG